MQKTSNNLNIQKKNAGEKAVEFIENGMIIGLGSGSTANFMIEKLAQNVKDGLNIVAVSTSVKTTVLAKSLGIKVVNLKDVEKIDLTIDGADEIDSQLNGIKGGGGALLHEKIVAASSKKNIWVIDSSKYVKKLGAFPLPVEVVQFGAEKIFNKLLSLGYLPKLRTEGGENFVTDSSNYIIDLSLNIIDDPYHLDKELKLIPGIIETGLFLNLCDIVIIGKEKECEIIMNKKKADHI